MPRLNEFVVHLFSISLKGCEALTIDAAKDFASTSKFKHEANGFRLFLVLMPY